MHEFVGILILVMWEFFFLFAWLWKNLVVVNRYVKKFDCGEILVGH